MVLRYVDGFCWHYQDGANGLVIQNKTLDAVKGGSKASSAQTSRAVSVSSNGTPAGKGKGKGRGKK